MCASDAWHGNRLYESEHRSRVEICIRTIRVQDDTPFAQQQIQHSETTDAN